MTSTQRPNQDFQKRQGRCMAVYTTRGDPSEDRLKDWEEAGVAFYEIDQRVGVKCDTASVVELID